MINVDFQKYKEEFLTKVGTIEDYPSKSIFFSEALAVYSLSKYYKIDMLIESGVFLGGSTSIWVNTLDNIQIRCFDILESPRVKGFFETVKDRYKSNPNIELTVGNGIKEVPKLIQNNSDLRIGVFVDGPKNTQGLDLCKKSLKYPNVFFTCLHDYTSANSDTTLATKTDSEFRKIVEGMDNTHPQYSKYPKGPGLYCLIK